MKRKSCPHVFFPFPSADVWRLFAPQFCFFLLFLLFFYTTPAILTFIERETQIRHLELFSKHPFTFSFPFVFFLNRLAAESGTRGVRVTFFGPRVAWFSPLFFITYSLCLTLFLFFLHLLFFIISLFQFLWVFFLSLYVCWVKFRLGAFVSLSGSCCDSGRRSRPVDSDLFFLLWNSSSSFLRFW